MAASFITGISGFAGSHLAELLLARGDRVVGLVREAGPTPNLDGILGRIELAAGDICDLAALASALRDARPERIFHLAGLASPLLSFTDPLAFYHVNTLGTATLFEAISLAGLREARVVVVTSAEAYGRSAHAGPIPEETPLRPVSPYGASKAAAEAIAIAAFEGRKIAAVRARAFNHTGARQEAEFAAAAFARQIALAEAGRGDPVLRVGPLEAIRDFSHVEEVVAAYAALAEAGTPGEVYNVGSGRGVKIEEVLRGLLALARVPIAVEDDPTRRRPSEIPSLVADTGRLERAIGRAPARPLGDALGALLDSWRGRVA